MRDFSLVLVIGGMGMLGNPKRYGSGNKKRR